MSDEFTLEEISAVFAGENDHLTCKELREKLTKPKWLPVVGQIYRSESGHPYKHYEGHTQKHSRPLNTKEAGPECMQHLVDAIKWAKDTALINDDTDVFKKMALIIENHKELIK